LPLPVLLSVIPQRVLLFVIPQLFCLSFRSAAEESAVSRRRRATSPSPKRVILSETEGTSGLLPWPLPVLLFVIPQRSGGICG